MTTRSVTVAYRFDKDLIKTPEAKEIIKTLPKSIGTVSDTKCNLNYPVHRKQSSAKTTITSTSIPGMKVVTQEQRVKVAGKRGRPKGSKDKKKRKPRR